VAGVPTADRQVRPPSKSEILPGFFGSSVSLDHINMENLSKLLLVAATCLILANYQAVHAQVSCIGT
jgi:hypothetical protein